MPEREDYFYNPALNLILIVSERIFFDFYRDLLEKNFEF